MAKILIVDDHAENRELVVSLIRHGGHRALEAADGEEGLALVRAERPDLVISDILMPTMDGYEFVRRLRADPAVAATEVIFYSAHYREREARSLAQACGVTRVLSKPCEPEDILRAIEDALAHAAQPVPPPAPEFDREHLRVMTDKLSEKVAELEAANGRLAALTELNLHLASERDPLALLEKVCRGARELLGAKYAVLCVTGRIEGEPSFFTSGIEASLATTLAHPDIPGGKAGEAVTARRALRLTGLGGNPGAAGLPDGYPPLNCALVTPIVSLSHSYGWVCLADKLGAAEFSAEDEEICTILAAQVGRIYENGSLYREVQSHARQLQIEIAERKQAAEDLQRSEELFRQIAENIREVFFLIPADQSTVLYISPAYEEVWGTSRAALYADPNAATDAIHPDDRDKVLKYRDQWRGRDGFEYEYRIVRPDGDVRSIRSRGFGVRDEAGEIVRYAGIAEDITEQIYLRKALQEREAGLHRAQVVARLAHVITGPDGSFETWSDSLPAMIGLDAGRMVRSTRAWLDLLHPDDREMFRRTCIQAGISGTRINVEYRLHTADGTWLHLHQVMEPLEIRESAGRRMRWFNTILDVTELRSAEEEVRRLNASLERTVAERTAELQAANSELESFDYSVSHDLRAPIQHIHGFTDILIEEYGERLDERGRGYLQRVRNAAARMNQLVGDLLALSLVSRTDLKRVDVDMTTLAHAVIADLPKLDAAPPVEFIVAPGLVGCGDRGLLRIVLENLLGNARKFSSRRSAPRVEFGREATAHGPAFCVRDNGAGFDAAFADRLFAPFQRLHSQSEFAGTGIGLATVRRIVSRHGGRVWAEGAVDQGAAIYFTLSQ